MKKIITACVVFFSLQTAYSQRDTLVFVHFTGGASYAIGQEMDQVYDFGLSAATHVSIPAGRVIIEPGFSFFYFGNYYSKSTRDNLLLWNMGSRIHLNWSSRFDPFIGAYFLIGKDYLEPRKDYRGSSIDLMTFRGMGISAGLNFYASKCLYFQLTGEFVTPKARLDKSLQDDIKEELEATSSLYNIVSIPDKRISLNTISLKIGYKLSLKHKP